MTIYLEFGWNSHNEDLIAYLKRKDLRIRHKKGEFITVDENFGSLSDGMVLVHKTGVVMRVMGSRFSNYENLSHDYVLSSHSIKPEQLELFRQW